MLKPIGIINSPYESRDAAPIQSRMSDAEGTVRVFEDYAEGLEGIEGFSHIILVYLFHKSKGYSNKVVPFLDSKEKGVFATRSPSRPNPIGLSVVKLLERRAAILSVKGLDMVDGTPLFDIKPYVPAFDCIKEARQGWLEGKI